MNKRIINEGLDYLDMVGQINPILSVDELLVDIYS
jgi:hypothetical protein